VFGLDRSTDTGDASLLILVAVTIAMVALVARSGHAGTSPTG